MVFYELIQIKTAYFNYDELYRLTYATTTDDYLSTTTVQSFIYSIIGNITNKSDIGNYSYGNDNPYQASAVAGTNYTYDDNGNLTNDGTRTMAYDFLDRLTSVTKANRTTNYYYDHSKTRVVKQDSTTQAYRLYVNKYYEKTSSGIEDRYVYLGNQRIAIVNKPNGQNPQLYLNFSDYLNSATLITNATGTVTYLKDYYPYGDKRVDVQNGAYNPNYLFTDQEFDNEADQYYYDARYYQQDIGRFIQADPLTKDYQSNDFFLKKFKNQGLKNFLGDPQNLNQYSYARNNPIILNDPTGNFWWSGFYDFEGYSGVEGIFLKLGEVYGGRNNAVNTIERNSSNITNTSQKYNISADLIKAIIYEEVSHLFPGEQAMEEIFTINNGLSGDTVGIGQINTKYWNYYSRKELLIDENSIDAIGQHLDHERSRLESEGIEVTNEMLASRYNNTEAGSVSDYGLRIKNYIGNETFKSNFIDKLINIAPNFGSPLSKFKNI